ncbi:ectoine/hydroxyectoine ABC transporter permease subunit EhuD [Amycolatopsis thermoflava]|uniref:ectoine/hydroxyectoine ABC transporter permease subunit EhuD n=1 Tax=Amycolatopsis thermoflava TaxID=84480 RepID=UPI003EBBA4AA
MNWDWSYVWAVFPSLVEGLKVTVLATAGGSAIAFSLGLLIAVGQRSPRLAISLPLKGYVQFVRGTPLLVQLFFLYYVLPEYGVTLPATVVGVLALGLHYSTYASEVYRSGIESISRGQWEAALSLNLATQTTWRTIVVPQVFRAVLPALGNYVIDMFKATPLLSAVTVMEMVYEARTFGDNFYRYLEPFTITGVLFLVISLAAATVVRRLERSLVRN